MPLPPAEKLTLNVRKNVRDNFEEKKGQLEEGLSKALGVAWTLDINPLAIWPYAEERYAKESFGNMLFEYVNMGSRQLQSAKESVRTEVNNLADKHILTITVDEAADYKYCSCAIKEGVLQITFNAKGLGSNISEALAEDRVKKALNDASAAAGKSLSFLAEESLRKEWYPKVADFEAKVTKTLGQAVKLNPNLEENFAKLKAEAARPGNKLMRHWETAYGNTVQGYFNGLCIQLDDQKFTGDEMLQEGFFDAVSKKEVVLRIVNSIKGSWNEAVIEDGVLYIQTTVEKWANNVHDAGKKVVDLL